MYRFVLHDCLYSSSLSLWQTLPLCCERFTWNPTLLHCVCIDECTHTTHWVDSHRISHSNSVSIIWVHCTMKERGRTHLYCPWCSISCDVLTIVVVQSHERLQRWSELWCRKRFCTARLAKLVWGNLGKWDEFWYESCPMCRIDSSACWYFPTRYHCGMIEPERFQEDGNKMCMLQTICTSLVWGNLS